MSYTEGFRDSIKTAGLKTSEEGSGPYSKEEAHYTDKASNPAERCELCAYFSRPDKCSKVKGTVSPLGWCMYFEKDE